VIKSGKKNIITFEFEKLPFFLEEAEYYLREHITSMYPVLPTVKYPRLKAGACSWDGVTSVCYKLGLTRLSQGIRYGTIVLAIGLRYRRKQRYQWTLALIHCSTRLD